ncbi:OmpP1/FadL family transporter [Lebetimonas sp. JS138]|uniref:OmpP1/FadL family transporter n=1 Tax=Lebetimonas sp. JS138 TaxID=990072 RepID=UPI00046351CD|nr:outer membrane protein transport protein [Lebetimonas sp. JS138]
MKKIIAFSLISSVLLLANGYKIPEQSIDGMALSAANVADANGADSNYYNPANMVFNDNKNHYEFLMSYIHLYQIEFDNNNGDVYKSRKEDYFIPLFHFSSKDYNSFRWGISITTPAGLSKKWDDTVPELGAKEFTLKTLEINPNIAYKINNNLAVAFGVRALRSEGTTNAFKAGLYSQYLNGDSVDFGWNSAVSYQNDSRDIKLALTYRSKIDMSLNGDASGYYSKYLLTKNPSDASTLISFNTEGKVKIPLPAALNIAFAKTFNNTTVEFVLERTFWSKYKNLDFNFDDPYVEAIFGTPIPKNWKNTNTYRIGLTHKCSEKLTAMLGYTYDKTPVPDSTLDFSLPDSDKNIFSGGFKYKMDERMSLGFSMLYAKQKQRSGTVKNNIQTVQGTFKKGGALLMAFGLDYDF